MKSTRTLLAATFVAAMAALPSTSAELQRDVVNRKVSDLRELSDEEQRRLMHITVVFDECVGVTLQECQDLIQADVDANPEIFGGRDKLNYEVMNVRTTASADYYKVGLRTNLAETTVAGILGDGMVWYPWEWCKAADDCYTIGPWDCDVGTPLTVFQCCNMIKATVPDPDQYGNYLDCYVDPPIGSVSKPTDPGRVCIHVDSNNIVVRAPRNE